VGPYTLRYGIAPNPGALRSATFTIANRSYTVTQAAAQAQVAPFMAAARFRHAAAVLQDGRVLVIGGETVLGSTGSMTAAAEIYDPATNVFSPTAALAYPRSTIRATTLADGRVLVAGGATFGGGGPWTMNNAEIFDPAAGTWSTVPMGALRGAPLQVALQDGRVLVVGGGWSDGTAEIFDPATGAFTPTGTMNVSRRNAAAALLDDGRVIVVGGNLGPGSATPSAEIWNPATGAWTVTGNLALAREYPVAIRLASGKVLVTGGITNVPGAAAASELYDPAAGTFSATGALNVARYLTAAVLLPGGDVLVSGGMGSALAGKSLERYDATTGSWRSVGELREARSSHTASVMPDGKVLFAGGTPGPVVQRRGSRFHLRHSRAVAREPELRHGRGRRQRVVHAKRGLRLGGHRIAGLDHADLRRLRHRRRDRDVLGRGEQRRGTQRHARHRRHVVRGEPGLQSLLGGCRRHPEQRQLSCDGRRRKHRRHTRGGMRLQRSQRSRLDHDQLRIPRRRQRNDLLLRGRQYRGTA
jgi:hypothetical protein